MMTCLAPLMIARVMGWQVYFYHYLGVIVLGLAAMLTWKYMLNYGAAVYEGAIGFLVTMPLLAISAYRANHIAPTRPHV